MRVGIVAQKGNARAAYLAGEVKDELESETVEVRLDTATADAVGTAGVPVDKLREFDLVTSIGGDGTFLYAASGAGGTPVLGVNLGEVGFLNAVSPDDAIDAITAEVEEFQETGAVRTREVPRVKARGESGWSLDPAINEIGVQGPQRGHGQGLSLEVRVDGSLYTGGHADGVLVATSTGSTAYNLSEGGPLLRPGVNGLVVTEMSAASPMPPLVTTLDSEITIRADDASHAVVSSDSTRHRVETPEVVTVTSADDPVRIAGPAVDFFKALEKLD